ncbi:MAG: hypothetical protein KGN80_06165 [Acidobacteriota bacterium]|nr:hypothetical protein [Acidobacteriota bacterium]
MTRPQPWLFSRNLDLAAFGGSSLVALALTALGWKLGLLHSPLPLWAWLAVVVGVDVAHVHATWLRTYLDPVELKLHPARYALIPVSAWLLGAALHSQSALLFWRVLAYLAVFHFIRQQLGWVALYQRKEETLSSLDRHLDRATIYAATIWPLLWWHGHLPRSFAWFLEGDFAGPMTARLASATLPFYLTLLLGFSLRQFVRWQREAFIPVGKSLVVATTALTWFLAIVAFNSDWAFTLLNVLPHGIPYMILVWQRSKFEPGRTGAAASLIKAGPVVFAILLILVAYGEEWLWDLGIWHDHPALFGEGWDMTRMAQALVVPLLALPQATHYLLDGFIWKRMAP